MNIACKICKGACCEYMILSSSGSPTVDDWLGARATVITGAYEFVFDCKCDKLQHGKCSIYANRPAVCRDFSVGSVACFKAIRRQRPSDEAFKIMAAIVKKPCQK